MGTYILRRLLLIIPTLILVSIIVFLMVRFIPGGVLEQMVSQILATGEVEPDFDIEELRVRMGFDTPIPVQYSEWITGIVFEGDFGDSVWTGRPITKEIIARLPVSLELGIMALTIAMLLALPIGTYSAIRQDTPGDYAGRTVAILAISLPSFWVATIVIVYGALWLNWSPPLAYIPIVDDLGANLAQFIVPAAIMGMVMSGTTMRMCRTMMLEVLRQDYIRTAWAKGLGEWAVIVRHALMNALIPVITVFGALIPFVIAGSVVIEVIFSLPGLGRYLITALNQRDYPVVSGINLLIATFVLINNLVIDLLYGFLDPRVKYG